MRPAVDISPILVERFGQTMRAKLTTGEVSFRKAYLGSIVDRVEVDDHEIPHRRPQGRAGAGGSGERRSRARGSQFCLQMARREGFEPTTPRSVVR